MLNRRAGGEERQSRVCSVSRASPDLTTRPPIRLSDRLICSPAQPWHRTGDMGSGRACPPVSIRCRGEGYSGSALWSRIWNDRLCAQIGLGDATCAGRGNGAGWSQDAPEGRPGLCMKDVIRNQNSGRMKETKKAHAIAWAWAGTSVVVLLRGAANGPGNDKNRTITLLNICAPAPALAAGNS